MTVEEIHSEIAFRRDADHDARFDSVSVLASVRDVSVVERNGWQGVRVGQGDSGCIAMPIIYDSVRLVDSGRCMVAEVSIDDKAGAWILNDNPKAIVACEYDNVACDPLWGGLLIKSGGLEGLYSIPLNRMIFECCYAEVSLNAMSRFIWARKPEGSFIYYDSNTGRVETLPGAMRIFETDEGVLYSDEDNYVHLVNYAGVTDPLGLRRMVAAAAGRLRLHNSRMQTECVCDSTGYIIND